MRVTGGIQVDSDGRFRPYFSHNPSTLRLSSDAQQMPRGGTVEERYVKDMFRAPSGYTFWARDFSGIEARLVGWFAGSRTYTWLTGIDVHSFYTAYALNALDGRVHANDLPSIEWPEGRLRTRLKEIKKEFGRERNDLYKHLVHGANFLQTAHGAQRKIFKDTGKAFDIKLIQRVMGVYFELFPEIPKWHREICARVDGTKRRDPNSPVDDLGVCYARNPFGYVHRFFDLLKWTKIDSEWYSELGPDAARLVAFLPQSTAAAIIKHAARRLWYDHPEVGQTIRLLIHDEIFGEANESELEHCLEVARQVMEQPIMELPLDPSWQMGSHLVIYTEPKQGAVWSEMK